MEIEQINKYVGSKIKDYRKSFGLSQEELAKKIGVGKTTISNYEVGIRSPKKPQLIKLSEVFDVAIDDFFPQTDSTRINVSSTLSEINKISSQLEEPRQKIVLNTATNQLDEQNKVTEIADYQIEKEYPYYDDAVSAGTGQYIGISQRETITLPVEFDADYVVPVDGDSMEPEYHDGDYIFIESTVNVSDGEIGVFEYYGDTYVKQLILEDDHAYLHSLNKKYKDMKVDADSDFRVLGKVVGRYAE